MPIMNYELSYSKCWCWMCIEYYFFCLICQIFFFYYVQLSSIILFSNIVNLFWHEISPVDDDIFIYLWASVTLYQQLPISICACVCVCVCSTFCDIKFVSHSKMTLDGKNLFIENQRQVDAYSLVSKFKVNHQISNP